MVKQKASSVVPAAAAAGLPGISPEPLVELPRDFHFAVTWVTLFAHLDPIESSGPRRQVALQPRVIPSPVLALVPVVASAPLAQQVAYEDSTAAWEMVVPKMVRTETGSFTPAENAERELL
jgi:hypothetical protein